MNWIKQEIKIIIKKKLSALSRIELLIIDEFLLIPTTKRYFRIIGIKIWHSFNNICISIFTRGLASKFRKRALADAILDRIIANSYLIHIKENQSMRTRENK